MLDRDFPQLKGGHFSFEIAGRRFYDLPELIRALLSAEIQVFGKTERTIVKVDGRPALEKDMPVSRTENEAFKFLDFKFG